MSSPVATRYLPIDVIVRSKTNPRKTIDPADITQLAENIKTHGIIQPILTRPLKSGQMEIVEGERRWLAAKEAGLTEVPSIIRDYTDDEAFEIQLISFVQRVDIHPLDEAAAYEQLRKKKFDIAQISAKVGKERSYIAKRLQLVTLIEPAKKQLREGSLTLGHAIEIARLQPDGQKEALDEIYYNAGTASQLREWIKDELIPSLSSEPFKKDDATLVPKAGPCTTCPKRSSTNLDLFGDIAKKHDHCLDHKCFRAKVEAFQELNKAKKQENADAGGASGRKVPASMAHRKELYKRRQEIFGNRIEQEARQRAAKSLILRMKWPVDRKDFEWIVCQLMQADHRLDFERLGAIIGIDLEAVDDKLGYSDEPEIGALSKLTDQQLAQVVFAILVEQEMIVDPTMTAPGSDRLDAVCLHHGVDRKKIHTEVAKEMAPKKPKPPKAEEPKKKAKKATKKRSKE